MKVCMVQSGSRRSAEYSKERMGLRETKATARVRERGWVLKEWHWISEDEKMRRDD